MAASEKSYRHIAGFYSEMLQYRSAVRIINLQDSFKVWRQYGYCVHVRAGGDCPIDYTDSPPLFFITSLSCFTEITVIYLIYWASDCRA